MGGAAFWGDSQTIVTKRARARSTAERCRRDDPLPFVRVRLVMHE